MNHIATSSNVTMRRMVSDGIDGVFSSRWWWIFARSRAEQRLASSLECFGENSIRTRHAAQHCLRMDFAVRFWRSAPGAVMRVVKMAETAGVPVDDLRLVVLNRELQQKSERVVVRRQSFPRILSMLATGTVAMQWTLLIALTVAANGSLPRKILVIAVVTAIYAVLYRGWSLFAARPLEAVARSRDSLEAVCQAAGPAKVHQLRIPAVLTIRSGLR